MKLISALVSVFDEVLSVLRRVLFCRGWNMCKLQVKVKQHVQH